MRILIIIISCFYSGVIFGQSSYQQALDQGDEAFQGQKYDLAITKYFAADAFNLTNDATRSMEVRNKLNETFKAIQDLRRNAENSREAAIQNADAALSYELIWKARNIVEKDPTLALRLAEAAYKINGSDATIKQEQYRIYNENTFYKIIDSDGSNSFLIGNDRYQVVGNLIKKIEDIDKDETDLVKNLEFYVDGPKDNKRWKAKFYINDEKYKEFDVTSFEVEEYKAGDTLKSEYWRPEYEWSPDDKKVLIKLTRYSYQYERFINNYELFDLEDKITTGDKITDSLSNTINRYFNNHEIESTLRDSLIKEGISQSFDEMLNLSKTKESSYRENDVIVSTFSPDGKAILSVSIDGSLRLRDLGGDILSEFVGHDGNIIAVGFFQNGESVITRSEDNTTRLWDLKGIATKKVLRHNGKVQTIAISKNNIVATGSDDNTIGLWNINGDSINVFEGHSKPVWALAFSPDSKYLLSGSMDNTIRLWDLNHKDSTRILATHEGAIHAVDYSYTGDTILSASHDGSARLWDLKGKKLKEFNNNRLNAIHSVAFSPDGQYILTGHWQPAEVILWEVKGDFIKKYEVSNESSNGINSLAFSPDGKSIIYGSWQGKAYLRDLKGGLLMEKEHQGAVNSVAFSPKGNNFVTAIQEDMSFNIWDLQGISTQKLIGHKDQLNAVAYSSDGKFVITGANDNTAIIWSVNRPLADFIENGNIEQLTELVKRLTEQQKTDYGIKEVLERLEKKNQKKY